MHSRVETIRAKGLCRQEPDRNEIFGEDNPESQSYRASTTEIFAKCNEAAIDSLKKLKPLAKAKSRKDHN